MVLENKELQDDTREMILKVSGTRIQKNNNRWGNASSNAINLKMMLWPEVISPSRKV